MPAPDATPASSGLKFGTSGLRGLVSELAGQAARDWTAAFLAQLETAGDAPRKLLIGRDLRASSPGIAADCASAAATMGWRAVDCGALPTPALALLSMREQAPAVMVTGSHIPDDRNGLKFYGANGEEITKADEARILAALRPGAGGDGAPAATESRGAEALGAYRRRYLDFFGPGALEGLTVGVYQQSAVGRDLLTEILAGLGASAVPFGRSERFIPVDTEAHRPEDVALLRETAGNGAFFAIVSTDGDADRPLVADENGDIVRGDLLGLLTAQLLGSRAIVTPVTSSSAMERAGVAETVERTRVGSPFVIAGMEKAARAGGGVLGFEANGGVLLATQAALDGRTLDALPTRDAMLPILGALVLARRKGVSLRALVDALGAGHALADRLKEVASERSAPLLARLADDGDFAEAFFRQAGTITATDRTDGVRFTLDDGATVHFRASGNAPELRAYVEAGSRDRAARLLEWSLGRLARELGA